MRRHTIQYVHIVTDIQILWHNTHMLHDCKIYVDCLFVDHELHGLGIVYNHKLPDHVADENLLS